MQPLSVTQFVEFLNTALSAAVFPIGVTVDGEVAEYRVSQNKWIWFKIKDDQSLVECFATVWQLRQPLEDGMTVRVHGSPKLFGRSGKFSLNVDRAEPLGAGALRRAFELLKRRLSDEGLFAAERKRPLPAIPQRIGLIASGASAAYGDFCRILGERWGGLAISHYDVQVQGNDAVDQVVRAFDWFNRHAADFDLVVLTRGGGSLEDLAAFNSEAVARAVFSSQLPVVVGVGHERDETLADYAADVRAATPSHAAELIVPDRHEVELGLRQLAERLAVAVTTAVGRQVVDVTDRQRRLDERLLATLNGQRSRFLELTGRLQGFAIRLATLRSSLDALGARLEVAWRHDWDDRLSRVTAAERLLRGLDPQRLLERGYAIVRCGSQLVRSVGQVDVNEEIAIQLAHGSLKANVTVKKS